ncbi:MULTISPECIES: S8 family peptidase [Streptomyces]|uniref:S8 family serine peptidase n=1 Tax=Streptomyces caniscabiei TaxID=2746961 RepID=A0ABU4MF04_9ACTN|nr:MULTISPECIES: S8 family serine peptidase [Streptomyces]MBE4736307.1 S8 family serine peptidase [Streptomyces caniscabiei]MBE4755565.1 S8 family serine peptidase [Streptomyces caniscabiei]MBE4774337.1 S8 family serine peptidase [Streptomyces caniscabiei]MBE4785726.1 S8 family serine peptidase [Streptomyces caniscabiei]MBE4793747.1 S8 family serine peptidase [Streptomyces caniscabiei]
MAHLRSRRRLALAVPVVLSLTASLGFLPGVASAAPSAESTAATAEGPNLSYVVNTKTDKRTIAKVQKAIAEAGGKTVVTYAKIGVIVVHSTDPAFGAKIRAVRGVQSAGATRTSPLTPAGTTDVGAVDMLTDAEAAKVKAASADIPDAEPLEADQWDLRAIGADKAAKIDDGSRKVTVAVIDTGVDDTHPDLTANFSKSQSANCDGGVADTSEGAWRPYTVNDYHGTHVAGEIAAARDGVGVAGVAPGVKVSSINVTDRTSGLFYAESVVCAFVFAADKGVEITNNSYYVDPWLYNCVDDPDQEAIVDAVNRAQKYATRKGTLHLASAGNSNHDLASDAILDASSPNDTTPVERTIDPSECFDVPTQLPGIVTVSATGVKNEKSYYSTYGNGVIDIAAPGGDARYQIPDTPSKNGRILSTMPNGAYGYLQGTSMASPHAAGVAALLKSTHPWASPKQLQKLLKAQADEQACPTSYDQNGDGVQDAVCEGSPSVNGFYGFGIVNALKAVK